ncbi:MAG: hypothetical protein V1911_04300 [Candidatus Micrarchaeota archaeon]
MVLCGVCKENKKPKNKWHVKEHSVENQIMRDFILCDECAASLVRKIVKEMKPEHAPEEKTINLTRTELVDSIHLNEENELEINLSMDLAKARKVVMDEAGPK